MDPDLYDKLNAELNRMVARVLKTMLSAPDSDEVIDLDGAARDFIADCKRSAYLLSEYERTPGADIDAVIAAYRNDLAWFRFWAERHPDAAKRAKLKAALKPLEAENEVLKAHAQRHLDRWRERGVLPLKGSA